jgi:hypothetical protein
MQFFLKPQLTHMYSRIYKSISSLVKAECGKNKEHLYEKCALFKQYKLIAFESSDRLMLH